MLGTMLAVDALSTALTTAITGLVLTALARRARRSTPLRVSDGELLLVYPKFIQIGAWVGSILLGGLAIGVPVVAALQDDAGLWRLAMVATPGLGTLAALALFEPRTRLRCGEEGIGGRTAFRGTRHVRWDDVIEVTWSNGGYWLRLVDRQGEVVRVSGWLAGFPDAVKQLCAQVSQVVWKAALDKCRERMQQLGNKLELPAAPSRRPAPPKTAGRR